MGNVSKEYRGVPAVTNVDFVLQDREIHAIVGENGAGKSTLTKIIAGVTQLTRGEMLLKGEPRPSGHLQKRLKTASRWSSRKQASSPQ